LAGVVTREDALAPNLSYSPKMRLKMMGIQYAKIMGSGLEFVPTSPTPIFLPPVATTESSQRPAGCRSLQGSRVP
jgi:hypothetical protein